MAAVKGRRSSGGRSGRATLIKGYVRPEEVAKAEEVANRAGVSLGALLDLLLHNVELDDEGYPTWWPQEERRHQELPLTG